jgi:hypothetical protein
MTKPTSPVHRIWRELVSYVTILRDSTGAMRIIINIAAAGVLVTTLANTVVAISKTSAFAEVSESAMTDTAIMMSKTSPNGEVAESAMTEVMAGTRRSRIIVRTCGRRSDARPISLSMLTTRMLR